ncbi:DNA repair protein RecO [Candidatus Uhrbacteria bacterium CG_4_9_14_0_2_um_filter_41_50]|uniref:DNA repair protein RecO n=1 Tax=Candidatus Uhrbacteria bacterium CG_4_9_14_0_2_um_filter_41_50 TaxID=1975031 RepID=A0A2M8ENB5_9BACT|nr:MAG: DNA repair protein RecO [Candidatus Uhrbacteria bacterium CG_4_10_14_3_um_filter_41_21]PIZ55374.1 MAG: DNA repair protein RecO [Candidatus Uhrbacteria bacterium CG_4_10_14_0_2_um_filter_41_21]PJB84296.1 MAG: DNA repair protein RecO [Candidatus Uhrbacteria bacterium CG_4_9_14_0_8_um_filter_41_16]PJC24242.1 MAG: DNA repair protein RecO [Candidatus Uhrbacteria bacterium CG_4_9_14_0_2_um_filter_41_50]PJE74856.1 MAG: DNA repair protein RecO [Candidatus Uhrbacteria bacterium CG10_big_fil_rev_
MTWSTIKTEAIVLASYPFCEADRSYSAFTPEYGKVSFVGRGALKVRAKLAAHLEPFAIIDLEIIQGRRSTTVISVERKQTFRGIANSYEARVLALHSLSLFNTHTKEHDRDVELYQELLNWLGFLDSSPALSQLRSNFALGAFLMKFMSHLGYEVELKTCISCKSEILPLSFRWHGGRGGLVCSDCISKDLEEWFSARQIQEESIQMLRLARELPYADLLKIHLKPDSVDDFANIVHDLMLYHLPVEPRAPFWEGLSLLESDIKIG